MKKISLLILILINFSCLKEEIPIEAHQPGDLTTNQIELGSDYRYQAYYDVVTNSMVKKHLKTDWDFGFESNENGYRVILNTSKAMRVASKPITEFISTTDTANCEWKNDVSSGNLDSTAIGNWTTNQNFYIIDLGYSFTAEQLGFKKLQILSVNDNEYNITYSSLNNSNNTSITIPKNELFNFSFFSFQQNSYLEIEPIKTNWDLVFGQYTHLFDPTFPYLVTGVLSNRNGVEIAEVFDKDFLDINFSDVTNYTFSSDIDMIGYDWKSYSSGTYEIDINKNYIIKTTEGLYYKIHFIDFYNDQGDKGTPKFEISSL